MQRAVVVDQSVVKDAETLDIEYIDNPKVSPEENASAHENMRIKTFIETATSKRELQEGLHGVTLDEELQTLLDFKLTQLA